MAGENKELGEIETQQVTVLHQPIGLISDQTSKKVFESLNRESFLHKISYLQSQYELEDNLSNEDKKILEEDFKNIDFLEHLEYYISQEIISIYQQANIDAFSRVSFLGFLFGRGLNAFGDIHKIDQNALNQTFTFYETDKLSSNISTYYMKLYIRLLDFVGIVSTFNEMDPDRRKLVFQLTGTILESIHTVKSSMSIDFEEPISTFNNEKFGNILDYIFVRTGINSKHLQYIELEGDMRKTLLKFSEILNSLYSDFETAVQLDFLGNQNKKQSLTTAFISNVSTLMYALIYKAEKLDISTQNNLFHHLFMMEKIVQPYLLQMHRALGLEVGSQDIFGLSCTNFSELKRVCNSIIIKNYQKNLKCGEQKNSYLDVIEDMILILKDPESKEKIDFYLDFCYQLVSNTDDIQVSILEKLGYELIHSDSSLSYHTEAVRLKLIDTIIKKMSQSNQNEKSFILFLESVENYIKNNKKNSIILNIYARLYLTLSFAYSQFSSCHDKALMLYFVYKELNVLKNNESYFLIEIQQILMNLFPGKTTEEVENIYEFRIKHEKFTESKWHETQKKINQISLNNRIEGYKKALDILSDEFFYGMVEIYVINPKEDKVPRVNSAFQCKSFDIFLKDENGIVVLHNVLLHFPNNYANNFNEIWKEPKKQEHITEQIQHIFEKLGLYVSSIKKRIQNKVLEALENGQKRCVPYFQPISTSDNSIKSYECLMRLLDKAGKPLVIDEEIIDEKGDVAKKYYAIDEQLKVAAYLGLTPQITYKLLKDVFQMAEQNTEYEFNINLSYEDIMHDDIFEKLKTLSQEYSSSVGRVVIELLENKIHHNSYFDRVKELSNLGYKIAVDDFGSEYNNISILSQLHKYKIPVYKLKIDQIVIQDIKSLEVIKKHAKNVEEIVHMTQASLVAKENIKHFVYLAQLYGIVGGVVAEYVRDKDVFDTLKEYGIRGFQGYYIGKPNSTLEILKEV